MFYFYMKEYLWNKLKKFIYISCGGRKDKYKN